RILIPSIILFRHAKVEASMGSQSMKRMLTSLLLLLLARPLAGPRAESADAEDARLSAFFKEYLDELFRQRPLEATRLGEHRFDHLLDDVTPKARSGWLAHTRKTLTELPRRVPYRQLSR